MLHPQARALLRMMEDKGVPPTHTLSVDEARRFYRERRAVTQPAPPAVGESRDLRMPGPAGEIPLRLYRPAGSAAGALLPVLVYYHGGGWVIGDLDTHDTLCRELANGSGCAVVAVDYRMGPEHRFPAASDDALAAARWVRANAASLQVDGARMALGGDSAGGNLAAVTALAMRDAGDAPAAFQLLIYPATDQRCLTASYQANGQGYLLTQDTMRYFHGHYFGDDTHNLDWRASPMLAASLEGVPPALVLTAGFDPLRDEGTAYAQRLTESGVRTTLVCFERQIHGFILMGRVLDEANAAVQLCADTLRRALQAG
ncbi:MULTISPECIES: alpha/beta hydrolase [Ramlibacter]|uniref:Alpha/beta hydrolase n=1 Tax=Ramlibacter aquaticus TaxID=2780094 RepID=A0ABR9SDD8_9BURK|nr:MULTISPECIES: alpha/beta hydrolase [Ramlibacter]MBE7940371.1 alpha/beta hydrolase [Ramlibacter aquaticus]